MRCVVPLAGPDLFTPSAGFRPLISGPDGRGILETALEGRAWRRDGTLKSSDYTFVIRETPRLHELRAVLDAKWPGCSVVTLSGLTGGAMFSAMAGLPLSSGDGPLCVDLADIFFEGPADFWTLWPSGVGAVTPCFISSEPIYSYLRMDGDRVVEAAEKRVISDRASAGVYFFRDVSVYLAAAVHSIRCRDSLAYKDLLFVCPMMNGVIEQGLVVAAPLVDEVVPVGKAFHALTVG